MKKNAEVPTLEINWKLERIWLVQGYGIMKSNNFIWNAASFFPKTNPATHE